MKFWIHSIGMQKKIAHLWPLKVAFTPGLVFIFIFCGLLRRIIYNKQELLSIGHEIVANLLIAFLS